MQKKYSILGVTFEEALKIYEGDYKYMLFLTQRALQNEPLRIRNKYWRSFYQSIRLQLVPEISTFDIEYEDLNQQLSLFWWLCYSRNKDHRYLRKELRRFSLFRMRNWIRSQVTISNTGDIQNTYSVPINTELLDLKFLINGNVSLPYLSKRDRYELYLHFTNDKSITEMVDIVRYRKQNIIDNLKNNYEFLRSFYVFGI